MSPLSLEKFLQSIREQITQGDIQLALDRLQNYLSVGAPELRNEAILYLSRYSRLRRDEQRKLIAREEAEVEKNRLIIAVLEFLEDVPRGISEQMLPIPAGPRELETVVLPEEVGLEKIIGINNLKQISWIEHGVQAAKSVCRILTPRGLGTGFLIAPDLIMTNNHVIPSSAVAAESVAEFNYQQDSKGKLLPTCRYQLDRDRFHTSEELDYTIVGVLPGPSKPHLETWGCLVLNPNADPVPDEHVIIIQHPNGGLKQIVLTANQVFHLEGYRLYYTTDTMPGSSGSPVFNDSWQVIAIHHAEGGLQTNTRGDKRFVNEGILMSAIKADAGSFWPQ